MSRFNVHTRTNDMKDKAVMAIIAIIAVLFFVTKAINDAKTKREIRERFMKEFNEYLSEINRFIKFHLGEDEFVKYHLEQFNAMLCDRVKRLLSGDVKYLFTSDKDELGKQSEFYPEIFSETGVCIRDFTRLMLTKYEKNSPEACRIADFLSCLAESFTYMSPNKDKSDKSVFTKLNNEALLKLIITDTPHDIVISKDMKSGYVKKRENK